MAERALREAQEAFNDAIQKRAGHYATEVVQEAEQLIIQARHRIDIDATGARALAEQAREKAVESFVKAEEIRTQLKVEYGSALASYFNELSKIKHTVLNVERKLTRVTLLSMTQRVAIVEILVAQTRQALEAENFQQVTSLLSRLPACFFEIHEVLDPSLERLRYEGRLTTRTRKHQRKNSWNDLIE